MEYSTVINCRVLIFIDITAKHESEFFDKFLRAYPTYIRAALPFFFIIDWILLFNKNNACFTVVLIIKVIVSNLYF